MICDRSRHEDMITSTYSLFIYFQRARRKHLPASPASPLAIELDGVYGKTEGGEPWVLTKPSDQEAGILVLATTSNLRHLTSCTLWFQDGTFDVAPAMFDQVKINS